MESLNDDSRPAEDRFAAQRMAGFGRLRFNPALEQEYRQSYVVVNGLRMRAAALSGMASVLAFIAVDQFLGLNLQDQRSDLLLMLVTVPAILLPVLATLKIGPGAYLLPLMFSGVMLMSMSIVAVIYFGRQQQPWFPDESMILVTAYVYFVSGLMFYQAMVCGALLWAAFVITNWSVQSHDKLLYEAYYLAVANGLGCIGLYLLEHQARLAFLLRNELRHLAGVDSLTGVMNRRAFTAHLETAWGQAQRAQASLGLMLIDIDEFKRVNDTCGHQSGDQALQRVAQQLKASVLRPLDATARYGGDEFVALWFDVDSAWLARLAQDFPGRLAGLKCGEPGAEVPVTVSGGAVVARPRPGLRPRDAIHEADQLLYEMKRNSPGKIAFLELP